MRSSKLKCEIYRDSMQNYKKYGIPPAQLIIADVPYNIGNNFYGSNPMWYKGGDNKNGESKLAKKAAFNSDFNFNLYEYFHFCSKMMKKEPKKAGSRGRSSDAPCMIVFCSFEQLNVLIDAAKKHGFNKYIPLVFVKNYSPQVLKANMRVVGATEYSLLLYRDKLPKFRNGAQFDENGNTIRGTGHMVFSWFSWEKDGKEIETAPEYRGGWIRSEDRMSEDDEDVLVWFEYFRFGEYQRLFQTAGIGRTWRGEWSRFVNGSSGWRDLRIIAWQPLPEPYREEQEDNGEC